MISIGTYLQNQRKNFNILLLYLFPCFIRKFITSLISMSCISRKTSASSSLLMSIGFLVLIKIILSKSPMQSYEILHKNTRSEQYFLMINLVFQYFLTVFEVIRKNTCSRHKMFQCFLARTKRKEQYKKYCPLLVPASEIIYNKNLLCSILSMKDCA